MSKDPLEYLKHIRDECSFLLSVTGINYSIVWDVIKNKIPELYNQIIKVTGNEK